MLKLSLIAIAVLAAVLAAIPSLLWVIVWLIGLCFGAHVPFAPFGWTAAAVVAVYLITMSYGVWIGRFRLEVNQQELRSDAVPEGLDGFRIVHISDLHLSTFDDRPAALQRIVEKINEQQPDIVCFTGDLVSMGVSEALPYADVLKGIHAKHGVYSVLGNHDFLIYRRDLTSDTARMAEVEQLAAFEREELGWQLLRNEAAPILGYNENDNENENDARRANDNDNDNDNDNNNNENNKNNENDGDLVTILGCDNSSCSNQGFHTIYAGDLDKAMEGTEGFRVLLTHDPSHWRGEVADKKAIPLTLSGHTHAGQVRLFGWPLSSVSFTDNEGWYQSASKEESLYINRGLGCTLPLRLNCPEEITVITLRRP